MIARNQLPTLLFGLALGFGVGVYATFQPRIALAGNDRHENYILCTGSAGVNPRSPLDGVWLLDYKSGKLLATIVDRTAGKATGFAEMDLVAEFGAKPNQNVHFVMTTGTISAGQSALYLAETTTGKFGVYTLGPAANGEPGVAIMRHDLTTFRRKGE
jgi:hypothetical protein